MTQQFELFDIQNPCRGICRTDNRGYCVGCYRSREERLHWHHLTTGQKRQVLRLAYDRKVRRSHQSNDAPIKKDLSLNIFND